MSKSLFSVTSRLSCGTSTLQRLQNRPQAASSLRTQIAVVGSGPSGCYVAHFLTKKREDIHVDIFERLPVPFGLCRYGVAPDHPEVKNVERQFLEMFKGGRVTWIGNITVGKELPIEMLLKHYSAVVIATGAESSHKLGIPGEELGGVISAGDFVRYYNTYPFPYGSPRFCPFDLSLAREAVVIGNGNVAIDCARVMAASYKHFCGTDMNCAAVKELMKNHISRISVVARRGPAYSAFTLAEFRELTRFQPNTVRVTVDPFDLKTALHVPAENPRARKRLLEFIARFSTNGDNTCDDNSSRSTNSGTQGTLNTHARSLVQMPQGNVRGPCVVHMRYNLKPVRFLPHPDRRNHVGAVVFERTDADLQNVLPTCENAAPTVILPCDVAITSVGYCSDSIPGVAFDHKKCVIAHKMGRVISQPRVYCAGWVKNGPKGVILRTIIDAQETASAILEDIDNNILPISGDDINMSGASSKSAADAASAGFYGKYGLIEFFVEKRLEPVSIAGLERIFHVEQERGIDLGKRLEKIDNVRGMLDVALGGTVGKKANNSIRGIMNERPDALLYLNELLDDTTDLAPFARELARELPPVMAARHPPGHLKPSQL